MSIDERIRRMEQDLEELKRVLANLLAEQYKLDGVRTWTSKDSQKDQS